MEKTQRIAKKVLKPIREYGIPPQFGLELYSVGLENELRALEDEYLVDTIKNGESTFKFVSAGFGGGKTHFTYLFRELAWRYKFVSSYVSLSPSHTQFDKLLSVFRAICRELQRPLTDTEKEMIMEGKDQDEKGISNIIKRWYQKKLNEFKTIDPNTVEEKLRQYANTIRDLDNLYFTKVIRKSFESLIDNDLDTFENLMVWITSDYDKSLHGELGIRKINDTDTFSLIKSLSVLLRKYMEYSGLIIFFDEGERHSSTSKAKDIQISNLRQIIDACGDQSIPGTMFFYTVPDENEFLNPTGHAYEAIKQRLRKHFTQAHPLHPNINLEDLSPHSGKEVVEYLSRIGQKLADLYALAEGQEFDQNTLEKSIVNVATSVEKRLHGEVSYKRLFVQSVCQAFDIIVTDHSTLITPEKAEEIVRESKSKISGENLASVKSDEMN
jgi:hypothetical protein